MQNKPLPPRLRQAIRELGASRRKSRPIAMSSALRATKEAAPDLQMTDAELHDLIARELIASGCAVEFDVANEAQSAIASRRAHLPIDHGTPRSAR